MEIRGNRLDKIFGFAARFPLGFRLASGSAKKKSNRGGVVWFCTLLLLKVNICWVFFELDWAGSEGKKVGSSGN
ncbi:hypothetical protein H5410_031864 [Solanum commersonii]|uniref:Uncharacterized protein n=1 Tax=Solanum commersonii TaxID=4109 RepID=A0A9J5YNN2_SOLCO|nr:hypothetical protein H5410_031864 [Solanum commersonii]